MITHHNNVTRATQGINLNKRHGNVVCYNCRHGSLRHGPGGCSHYDYDNYICGCLIAPVQIQAMSEDDDGY